MAGVLEDGGHLGVGHEVRPTLLVPVEDRPDAVVVAGILEHHRTFGTVVLALVGALRPEHFQELLDVVDGRRGQNHHNAPSVGAPAGRLAQGQFSGSAVPAESVDLPICQPTSPAGSAGYGAFDHFVRDGPSGGGGASCDTDLGVN